MKLKTAHFIAGAVIVSAMVLPLSVFAQTNEKTHVFSDKGKAFQLLKKNNMLVGTVTAISGTTLTVTDEKNIVYTVDASNAKIDPGMLGGPGLTVSNILVGDRVVVTGPIVGTTETAKTISDRALSGRNIFMGTVTATNGSMLTIDSTTKKIKTSYTVDASSAVLTKGMKAGTSIVVSDIKIGDRVFAIGTLSGSTILATSVRDLSGINKHEKTKNNFRAPHGFGRK